MENLQNGGTIISLNHRKRFVHSLYMYVGSTIEEHLKTLIVIQLVTIPPRKLPTCTNVGRQ